MSASTYLDVEIRLFPRQEADYPVEMTLGGEQTFPVGSFAADMVPWVPSGDDLADGQRLFDALFGEAALRAGWAEARGRSVHRRVRLWVDARAAELHALPWELLHDGETLLAANANTPFSRYLPVPKPWGRSQPAPLRVLAAISNPADLETLWQLPALDMETERKVLEQALFALEGDRLQLDFLKPPVTLARLETALQGGVDVLHYVGHGAFNRRLQQAALYLQDDAGDTQIVQEAAVAEMLARQDTLPELVVLAACQSASRATTRPFLGLAPRLVFTGVPAVVAMQERITMKTARNFTLAFYRELIKGGVVDRATNVARSFLLTKGRPDAAVPVLFMRLQGGRLWGVQQSAEDAKTSGTQIEIGGDVSGQMAVGNEGPTFQIGSMSGGQVNVHENVPALPHVTKADLAELKRWIGDIKARVAFGAPPGVRAEAAQRLGDLQAAILSQPPDVSTMEQVLSWFSKHVPRLSGAVLHSIIQHQVTRTLVQAAGGDSLDAYQQLIS